MATGCKVRVNVTQEDIDNGERRSTTHCPIALALKRMGFVDPRVGHMVGVTDAAGWHCRFALPQEAVTFINAYDRSVATAGAFSFEMVEEVVG